MKVAIRKIGNSFGIIVPRALLELWNMGEGDHLTISPRGIFPPTSGGSAHEALDELKRKLAAAIVSSFAPREIRAHSLANLHRWHECDAWVSAYDEWKDIIEKGDDGALFAVMLGRDERSTRLRQSAPYVGLLSREEVKRLNEEATR